MTVLDGSGAYGTVLHYALILALTGVALLAFCYFWRKGLLGIDEETKIQMFEQDEYGPGKNKNESGNNGK